MNESTAETWTASNFHCRTSMLRKGCCSWQNLGHRAIDRCRGAWVFVTTLDSVCWAIGKPWFKITPQNEIGSRGREKNTPEGQRPKSRINAMKIKGPCFSFFLAPCQGRSQAATSCGQAHFADFVRRPWAWAGLSCKFNRYSYLFATALGALLRTALK